MATEKEIKKESKKERFFDELSSILNELKITVAAMQISS
jgi:hypothetical protein